MSVFAKESNSARRFMDLKQTAKTAGILWLILRVVIWLLTPSDPRYNAKVR